MIHISVQSLTRPSCSVVGFDLDKKISFGVPRYFGGMFFSWIVLLCLCIRTGWSRIPSACASTKDGRLELQAQMTSTWTTVFTAFTSFGLTAVSAWFASERYIFLRHHGKKWLSDVLMEYGDMVMKLAGSQTLNRLLHNLETRISRVNELLRKFFSKFLKSSKSLHDLETGTLPIVHNRDGPPSSEVLQAPSRLPLTTEPPKTPQLLQLPSLVPEEEPTTPISPGKKLWENAFRIVKMHISISPYSMMSVVCEGREPSPRQTNSSSDLASGYCDQRKWTWTEETINVISRSRAALLRRRLLELEPVHDLAAHSGLVRHMQFSPNGKYLATSRYLHR